MRTMPETIALFDLPERDVQLDLFAEAEVPEPGTRVRVPRRGGATGTVQAPDPIGAWFGRAHDARPTVSIKFDGGGFGLNYPEDVEVIPEAADLPDAAPIWVRTCNHVGCVLTSKHTHGVR